MTDGSRKLPEDTTVVRGAALISLGKGKLTGRSDVDVIGRVRKLATFLRNHSGVREVHAVWFEQWDNSEKPGEGAPWMPYGAFVVVEARDYATLRTKFDDIFGRVKAHKDLDQEMMAMSFVNDW